MKKWKVPKVASAGYAIAPVYVVEQPELTADTRKIPPEQWEDEIRRFEEAVAKVQEELLALSAQDDIFFGHYVLAGDMAIRNGVSDKIRNSSMNAEAALLATCEEYVHMFEAMEDEYMRERAADMRDVTRRLLLMMQGKKENVFAALQEKSILVARELTPSDTVRMNLNLVAGFVTEEGGVTSHVSIIAKNYGIPCLVGVGRLLSEVQNGMEAILDAQEGQFYLEPEAELIEYYQRKIQTWAEQKEELRKCSAIPAESADGVAFRICANAGSIREIQKALQYQIDGVGLLRTEFLYMETDHFPTEEEQFAVYREAAELLEGRELTVRTLDIGGDKKLSYCKGFAEQNPYLGCRGIRWSLAHREVFKVQLRAILRASAFGKIRIMYPMVSSMEELQAANGLLEECTEELQAAGVAYDKELSVGMIVETPAAVMMVDAFAQVADFFSVGTNDLTQYLLAVDRGNPQVSDCYNTLHPAVLRAVHYVMEVAHRHGRAVCMCGEAAGDERAAAIWLAMGLDMFSMSPEQIPVIKKRLHETSCGRMKERLQDMKKQSTIEGVMKVIQG